MQPAIDRNTLERLIALGRQRGILTNRDLQEELPIGIMSAEDIALVVVHLEEAGVPVDLEESLLDRSPQRQGAEIISFPKRSGSPQARSLRSESLQSAPSMPSDASAPTETSNMRGAHWTVFGSILLLALIGLVILALGY
jgi:hypothetical protein